MTLRNKYTMAIRQLAPGAHFSVRNDDLSTLEWISQDIQQPSLEKIEETAVSIQNAYNNTVYQRKRLEYYPPIQEQLDMLYHDIKNGKLDSGDWIEAIEEVKLAFPKP